MEESTMAKPGTERRAIVKPEALAQADVFADPANLGSLDDLMTVRTLQLKDGEPVEGVIKPKRHTADNKGWMSYEGLEDAVFYSTEGDNGAKLAVVEPRRYEGDSGKFILEGRIKFIPVGASPKNSVPVHTSYHAALGQIRDDCFGYDLSELKELKLSELEAIEKGNASVNSVVQQHMAEYRERFRDIVDLDKTVVGIVESFMRGMLEEKFKREDVSKILRTLSKGDEFGSLFFGNEFDAEDGYKLRKDDFDVRNVNPKLAKEQRSSILSMLIKELSPGNSPTDERLSALRDLLHRDVYGSALESGVRKLDENYDMRASFATQSYRPGEFNSPEGIAETREDYQGFVADNIVPKLIQIYVNTLRAVKDWPQGTEDSESHLAVSRLNRMARTALEYFGEVSFSYETQDGTAKNTPVREYLKVFEGLEKTRKQLYNS